jgi:demethylmenaquinone methyltransferase / 2-methoxy-6-polyprenyl-1,4-benzoquinol methylase
MGRVNYSVERLPSSLVRVLETDLRGSPTIRNDQQRDSLALKQQLGELDLEAHLADPALKQRFVTPLFDLIAPTYDRFTRLFSFGMDRQWKRELTSWIAATLEPDSRVLDLACGTGDLAFAAGERALRGDVLGVDASAAMVAIARARAEHEAPAGHVRFEVGDISALELPSGSIDAVTAGYALRNVPNHVQTVAEIARVLKPGGVVATLDFYRPESWWWRPLFLTYLRTAGNWVGWLWHRQPIAYGYIAPSIDHFVSWQRFSATLEEHGLRVERVRPKLLGGVAIHVARRVAVGRTAADR